LSRHLQRILIQAPETIANRLEGKLRKKFEVTSVTAIIPTDCQISVKFGNRWITVCRFAMDEDLDNILMMFQVKYEMVKRNLR
jgi:hypothetical protein